MGSVISLLLISLASRVSEGAVSVYTLASNLAAVPLSLIGASYATAAFPVMAQAYHEGKKEEFRATLIAATRHIIFWTSVITVLTVVMRAYLVRVIYGTGAFNWDDTRLTAAVLAILVMGLMAQCIILLCARAFYAAERSWNPFFVQLADFGVSVGSAWGMLQLAKQYVEVRYFIEALFRVGEVPGTSVLFIALGATIGQILMAGVALFTLRTVAPGVAKTLTRPLFEGFGAAILGGAASYGVLTYTGTLLPLTNLSSVFLDAAAAGMVGLIVSGCILSLLENQEFRDLLQSLRKVSGSALRPSGLPTDAS
jgi:peptidoglycan biosynthesis protein MviN/MurJ (putative lipid II flippase)